MLERSYAAEWTVMVIQRPAPSNHIDRGFHYAIVSKDDCGNLLIRGVEGLSDPASKSSEIGYGGLKAEESLPEAMVQPELCQIDEVNAVLSMLKKVDELSKSTQGDRFGYVL
jgi:hypothetical protein